MNNRLDELHKNLLPHWDVTCPRTGKVIKEVDYDGKEITKKNKNRK